MAAKSKTALGDDDISFGGPPDEERPPLEGAASDDLWQHDIENDPEVAEWSKLRCTSERTELVAEREDRRQRRCADYPGLAFGRSIFSSDTMMKFSIIRNELHNIKKTQLKRVRQSSERALCRVACSTFRHDDDGTHFLVGVWVNDLHIANDSDSSNSALYFVGQTEASTHDLSKVIDSWSNLGFRFRPFATIFFCRRQN